MKYDATTIASTLLLFILFQSSHVLATDVTDTHDPLWDSKYTASQNRSLRIVSICFSSLSLLAGTYGIFWFFFHQYKKRHMMSKQGFRSRVIKFRRKLVLALILFDFLKALMLTIYPAKKLCGTPDSPQFAAVIGWFTNVAIEGGDMSAFLLAVQTAMMVFAPQNEHSKDNLWNRRFAKYFKNGLYPYRKYIYVFCFTIFPTLLSSLAFVGTDYPAAQDWGFRGYVPLPTFVFLPAAPVWYRAVLSWGPRYFIMFAIFTIYIAVFIHVRREFKRLDVSMAELAGAEGGLALEDEAEATKGTWTKIRIWLSHFPGLGALYHHHHHGQHPEEEYYGEGDNEDWSGEDRPESSSDLEAQGGHETVLSTPPGTPTRTANSSPTEDEGPVPVTPGRRAANLSDLQSHINKQNLKRFRQRRADIERQMNYIFIYPLAYLLLWTGPFVQQAMQYSKHKNEYSKFSVMIWAVVSQASNCFIDTVVFILRESNLRKWRRERKMKRAEEATEECTECHEHSDKSHEDDAQSRNEENESSAGTIISPPTFGNYEMRFGGAGGGGGCAGGNLDYCPEKESSDPRDSDPLSGPSPGHLTPPSAVTYAPSSRKNSGANSGGADTVPEMMFVRSPGGVTFGGPFGRRSGELEREPAPGPGHFQRDHHRGSISWGFGGRRKSEFSNKSGDDEVDLVDFLKQ